MDDKTILQTELANRLGLSQGFLSQLFNGKKRLGWDNSKRIGKLTGVEPSVLMDATPEQLQAIFKAAMNAQPPERVCNG